MLGLCLLGLCLLGLCLLGLCLLGPCFPCSQFGWLGSQALGGVENGQTDQSPATYREGWAIHGVAEGSRVWLGGQGRQPEIGNLK